MFTGFLQGILGKIVPLLGLVFGVIMLGNGNGAGVVVILLAFFFGAFLRYLSRHTVRVRK
jgi:hypothetical protein